MEINKRDPPQELNHSFHHHTLFYYSYYSVCPYYCYSCHKSFDDDDLVPCYYCDECNFLLDVKCALMEAIRCEGQEHIEHFSHQHPMPVVEIDPQHHIQCFACKSLCSGPAYACRACEYFLHKSCADLPRQIQQHPAHSFHPLFLRVWHYPSFTCNICGEGKIVKVFNGDLGGVKLKVIGQDFWEQPQEEEWDMSSSFTLRDLLSSNELTELEKWILNRWLKWDKSSKGEDEDSKVEVADEDIIDEIITRYHFFNRQEDLTRFFFDDFHRFYINEKLVVKSSELSLKIVGVQGYSIPVTLAPVLQTLLHKYPDITTSDSKMTPAMKSICFFFLCKVRNSMHTTRFADITKNLLRDWYYYLKFLRSRGFRIDFLMEALTKVTRAFAGVQLARLETEVPTKLNKKIVKLQQEIADLKAKEDICNKLFESSSDPKFIKDIFREGAEFKWKTADQVLF